MVAEGSATESPWRWAVEPLKGARSFVQGDFQCILVEGQPGATAYLFTPGEAGPIGTDYRPVLIDDDGTRHVLVKKRGVGNRLGFLDEYASSDSFELKGEWQIGIEQLTVDGKRQLASEKAALCSHQTLPFPEVGKPYDFSLEVEGEELSSQTLKGKVIIIHCWHTRCGPCIGEVPLLRELQEQHGDALVVIGVNFDVDRREAIAAIETHQMSWPQVLVPDDQDVRDAWRVVSTITGFPRNFLVDRDGVLRADVANLPFGVEFDELLRGE